MISNERMMTKFLARMLAFTGLLTLGLYGFRALVPAFEIVPFYLLSIVYFTLLNTGIFFILHKRLKESNKKFMFAFYLSTIIRMFGSVFVLAIYLVSIHRIDLRESVVYIILYFFYTAFEVVNLIPNLRPDYKKEH